MPARRDAARELADLDAVVAALDHPSRRHVLVADRLAPEAKRDFRERCRALGADRHTDTLEENLLTRLEVELAALELVEGVVDLTRVGGLLTVQTVAMWLKTTTGVD